MRFLLLMKYNSGICASTPVPTLRRNKELLVHLRQQHTTAAVCTCYLVETLRRTKLVNPLTPTVAILVQL